MTREIKELLKRYNGSATVYNPPKSSLKSIDQICNTAKLAKNLTIDKLIRDIRKSDR